MNINLAVSEILEIMVPKSVVQNSPSLSDRVGQLKDKISQHLPSSEEIKSKAHELKTKIGQQISDPENLRKSESFRKKVEHVRDETTPSAIVHKARELKDKLSQHIASPEEATKRAEDLHHKINDFKDKISPSNALHKAREITGKISQKVHDKVDSHVDQAQQKIVHSVKKAAFKSGGVDIDKKPVGLLNSMHVDPHHAALTAGALGTVGALGYGAHRFLKNRKNKS